MYGILECFVTNWSHDNVLTLKFLLTALMLLIMKGGTILNGRIGTQQQPVAAGKDLLNQSVLPFEDIIRIRPVHMYTPYRFTANLL